MSKSVYLALLGFFVILGMACAFISQIPDYYLGYSFETLAFCCLGALIGLMFFAPILVKGFKF